MPKISSQQPSFTYTGAAGGEDKGKVESPPQSYSYAHDGHYQSLMFGAAQNLPRLRKKLLGMPHSETIPVIARNAQTQQRLRAVQLPMSTQCRANGARANAELETLTADLANAQSMPGGEGHVAQLQAAIQEKKKEVSTWLGEAYAIENTPILGPGQLRQLRPQDKLRVLGHGGAGVPYITSTNTADAQPIPLKDVAQGLRHGGLSSGFKNFSLTSCFSADTEERNTFVADPPAHENGATAPAQVLVNELATAGFQQPVVKGYQGLAQRAPDGLRAAQFSPDQSTVVARTQVRKDFIPD